MEFFMENIAVSVFVLVVGFILLIKGADFFVDGSSSVAKMLRVPPMMIGLTIVAIDHLPECAVSVTAAVSGSNTLAISNVVGSNIFNLMMVCGVCALFNRLPSSCGDTAKGVPAVHHMRRAAAAVRIHQDGDRTDRRRHPAGGVRGVHNLDDLHCDESQEIIGH